MDHYDFFIAGRWRNYSQVKRILDLVRSSGKTAYCFIENLYAGEQVDFSAGDIEDNMRRLEALDIGDDFVNKVFGKDMTALKHSDNFLLVLPAGISGHIEAGTAYGLDKNCYAIGQPEKTETLYRIFDRIFPTQQSIESWLINS